ncbi:MAG: cytochrome P450 [Hyphomonas sp.]|uniref:cytochrome P450 n=1 Tax=Hyphomonas sp. TaxID=87 RepID=UPI0035274035
MTERLSSQAYLMAPHQRLAEIVAAGPFAETKLPFFGRVMLVTRHAGVQALLKETGRFAVDARNAGHKSPFALPLLPKSLKIMADNLLSLDDPDHNRLRRLTDAPFRRAAIALQRPAIAAAAHGLLDAMERDGNSDLVSGFCRKLPLRVIYGLLGFRPETEARLNQALDSLVSTESPVRMLWGILRLGSIQQVLREEFEALRAAPREGLVSELVHAEAEGHRMSENELLAMVFVLFVAGHETTTHLLSTGVWTLLTQDGAADAVRAMDEDARLVAVDELMRYCCPVQMTKPRFLTEDMAFEGRSFRRGDKLFGFLASANMDPDEFPDPLKLDLARRPNRHVGFGTGPHQCLGLHLARLEGEVALDVLFSRYPGLAIDGEPMALRWIARAGLRGLKRLPLLLR